MKNNFKISCPIAALKLHTEMLKEANRFQTVLTNLRYEGKPCLGNNIRQTQAILAFLKNEVIQQFQFEEKILFPFLIRHIPKLESVVRLLESEHDEFQSQLKSFYKIFRKFSNTERPDGKSAEVLHETGTYLVYLLRHHIKAESRVFKAMNENLRADEKAKLKQLMKDKNHGHEKRKN